MGKAGSSDEGEFLTPDELRAKLYKKFTTTQVALALHLYRLGYVESLKPSKLREIFRKVKRRRRSGSKPKDFNPEEDNSLLLPWENDYTRVEDEVWQSKLLSGQVFIDRSRDRWFEDEGFMASALGIAMSSYSLWTFPGLCTKYGEAAVCTMYLIVTCFLTVPAIYLEMILGQFTQMGTFHLWRLFPVFRGLGIAMMINTFISVVTNNVRLAWISFYFAESFREDFSWGACGTPWTTKKCVDFDTSGKALNLDAASRSPAYEYFRARVLRVWETNFADIVLKYYPLSSWPRDKYNHYIPFGDKTKASNGNGLYSLENIGTVSYDLIFLLLAIYVIGYFILHRRIKAIGVLHFLLFLFAFMALSLVFVYGWLLPDAMTVLVKFSNITKNPSVFLNVEVWMEVIKHAILSSGLGTGVHIMYGSHRSYSNRRIKTIAFVAGYGSWMTHCFLAVTLEVFRLSVINRKITGKFTESYTGNDTLIEIFPLAINSLEIEHKVSRVYSACLYGAVALFSIPKTYGGIYNILRTIKDSFKSTFDSYRLFYEHNERGQYIRWDRYRMIAHDTANSKCLLIGILLVTFLPTVTCLTRGGIYILLFLENYAFNYSFMYAFLIEVVAVIYLWGIKDLDTAMESMTLYQSTVFYRVTWKYIMPGLLILYFIHTSLLSNEVEFDGKKLQTQYHYIGLGIFFSISIGIILLFVLKEICCKPVYGPLNKFKLSLAPVYEWNDLVSGTYISRRTGWLHYAAFPNGISEGKNFPDEAEELYSVCQGSGATLRRCCILGCSFGLCSRNLLCQSFPKKRPLKVRYGKAMRVSSGGTDDEKPVRLPNLKLIRRRKIEKGPKASAYVLLKKRGPPLVSADQEETGAGHERTSIESRQSVYDNGTHEQRRREREVREEEEDYEYDEEGDDDEDDKSA